MTNKTTVGERLREERSRLGFSQTMIAELCKVRQETWSRYEKDLMAPGMEVFQQLASNGADALYILTGARAENAAVGSHELHLLIHYRKLPRHHKRLMNELVYGLAGDQPKGEST